MKRSFRLRGHGRFIEASYRANVSSTPVRSSIAALAFTLRSEIAENKGVLLAMAVEPEHGHWPKEGLRLVRYETFADF